MTKQAFNNRQHEHHNIMKDRHDVYKHWFSNRELTEAKITYQFAPTANYDRIGWIEKQRVIIKQKEDAGDTEPFFIDFPIGDYRYSIFGGNDPSNECNMYFLKMLKMEMILAILIQR